MRACRGQRVRLVPAREEREGEAFRQRRGKRQGRAWRRAAGSGSLRALASIFSMSFACFSSLRASTVSLTDLAGSTRAVAAARASAESVRLHGAAIAPPGSEGRADSGGALDLRLLRALACGRRSVKRMRGLPFAVNTQPDCLGACPGTQSCRLGAGTGGAR